MSTMEQALREIEDTSAQTPDINERPEMVAALQMALTTSDLLIKIDQLTGERDSLRASLEASEGELTLARTEVTALRAEKEYFETAFDRAKSDLEAIDRLATHGQMRVHRESEKRPHRVPAAIVSPQDNGEPIPTFLTEPLPENVRPLRGKPLGRVS